MKQEISVMFDSRDWFVDASEAQKKCASQLCFASRLWLLKTKVLKTNKRKSFDLCRRFDSFQCLIFVLHNWYSFIYTEMQRSKNVENAFSFMK